MVLGVFFGLGKRYDEPTYDMSENNALGLYDERVNPTYYNDLGNELALETTGSRKIRSGPFAEFQNTIAPQAVNLPDSPEWTSWEVPPGMMNDAYQDNLEFFDNLNKGIVAGDRIPLQPDANVMQGSVLDAQPKKGIMERISDFFFTPAGAAELSEDELNIQKALGQKTYADTIK